MHSVLTGHFQSHDRPPHRSCRTEYHAGHYKQCPGNCKELPIDPGRGSRDIQAG